MKTPLGDLDLDGWTVLWAAVVVVATLLLARYAVRATLRIGERVGGLSRDAVVGVARVVRYAIYLLGVGVALSVLGAPIKPVLVALLLVLGALVLIGRGIADSFGAGLVLQSRRTLKLGDLIESSGHRGHVVDLNMRSVVIRTADGVTVYLPNSEVLDSPLLNFSTHGTTRSEIEVSVTATGADADLLAAPESARVAAVAGHGVLGSPAPAVRLMNVSPRRVVFRLHVWHAPDAAIEVRSRVIADVAAALRAGGDLDATVSWPAPAVGPRPPDTT
ncbi:mechanosensitive ion channel [Nocardioides sp. YIM 152315]|nr:mechanosensitive ion channel [Nocardioides sp. YIM 152315]